ncbi:MAG: prolyl oligopeptidase family serine peptidase [Gemmatimonadales bacterium]|jgi:dipeptidyl aminopeptidase/acylaminoacyl peptidase
MQHPLTRPLGATLPVALAVALVAPTALGAQRQNQQGPAPEVTFLAEAPTIDGVLDPDLARLPRRAFPHVTKADDENPSIPAHYRLAYGADFLYVYVEAEAHRFVYRDRAYQNGDGFAMVIAIPQPGDEPTEEFYVLACSAVDEQRLEWTRRVFWYYNVVHIFLPTSEQAQLEFHDGDGIIGFELYLPWRDVHPNHPWLSEGIGFNLRFVKATPNGSRNFYQVHPGSVGAENRPRSYVRLRFEEPALPDGASRTVLQPHRGNVTEGETLHATAVMAAGGPVSETVAIALRSGEGTILARRQETLTCDGGRCQHDVVLPTTDLPAGGYSVEWRSQANAARGEHGLTVLPAADLDVLRERLAAARESVAGGSAETIEFLIAELDSSLSALHAYETAASQRIQFARVRRLVEHAERGRDIIAEQHQFVRRAYRSSLDGTLQPYVVWIPPDFDPEERYPLLVFLHGSASTERNIIGARAGIPDGFIALGPRGRGPSNAWSWDHAQQDVAEAMQAVIDHYPIDADRIVLSGFSMGGYGVYRTYYETPNKFRALVVLSGSPNLANRWSGSDEYPDFTREEYLRVFRDVPMFVFHGRRDRNVSYEATASFVEQLRAVGADVEFHVEEQTGHAFPGPATVAALHDWIRRVLEMSRE